MTGRTAYDNHQPIKGLLDRIDAIHYSAEAAAHANKINSARSVQTPWRSPDELMESQPETVTAQPDEQATPLVPPIPELPDPEALQPEQMQTNAGKTDFDEARSEETLGDEAWPSGTSDVVLLNPNQLSAPTPVPRSRTFMLVLALAIGIGISLPVTFLTIFYFRNYAPELQAPAAHNVVAAKAADSGMAIVAKTTQAVGPTAAPKLVLKPIPVRSPEKSRLTTVSAVVHTKPNIVMKPSGERLTAPIAPLSASPMANHKSARFAKAGALTIPMRPLAPAEVAAASIRLIVLRELTVVAGDSISLPARLDPPPRIPNAGRVLIRGLPEGFSISQAKKSNSGAWVLDPRALAAARIQVPKTANGRITISIALAGKSDDALARADSTITVVSAPDATRLSSAEAATLVQRGDALMTSGDIDAARLLFRLAAEGSSGAGAFKLAETYDPNVAKRSAGAAWSASLERARAWYMRAAVLGADKATQRLRTLPSP